MDCEKIIVKNTCIIINNYKLGDCPKLEGIFSIWDPTKHTRYLVCLYYDEKEKKLYLPRGLDIWYIEDLFQTKAIVEKNMYDEFDTFSDMKIRYLPRDETQEKALRFMIGKGEYSQTARKSQLLINLNTGKGKTYVSIANSIYFGIKSIVIAANTNVLQQWEKFILEYTNISKREVYYIEGSNSIYRLLCKKDASNIKFFLATHSTIKSYGDTNGWAEVTKLFKFMKVGFKYFDEAHQNFDNICKIDYYTNTYKTFYVTATPGRSDAVENKIYQLAFKNVLGIDLFNRDEDPHTHYIAFRFNSKPDIYTLSKSKNKYGLDRNFYTNYIVHNINFKMAAICILNYALKLAKEPNDKILIYIGTNESILYMYQWIPTIFPFLYNNIGIYTSIISPEQKEFQKQFKVILTTTKSAGAAIDIKGLKVTVVLAEPFKSQILSKQTLGRTRDENTYYLELVDKGFFYCNKYFLDKRKVFNVYAKSCKLIELPDSDLPLISNNIIKAMHNSHNEWFTDSTCNITKPFEILED